MPSGYGQQTPEDSNSDLGAVAFIVRQMMAQMDTMKLVQVVAVHGGAAAIAAAGKLAACEGLYSGWHEKLFPSIAALVQEHLHHHSELQRVRE